MTETPTTAIPRDILGALTTLGMWIFPVDHPALAECVGRHGPDRPCGGSRGKHPAVGSWSRESTNDPAALARMFVHSPRNVGVDCARSRLVVLDEDERGELDRLCLAHERELPVTLTVLTGKGQHVYLRQPADLPFTNAVGALSGYRIDVRGAGGFVVGPGSRHANGRTYSIASAAPIAPVPGWIAALLRPPAPQPRRPVDPRFAGSRPALVGVLNVVLRAPNGQRNTSLNWAAFRMFEKVRSGQLSTGAAEGMLSDAAAAVHLPEGEARATIGSARRAVLGA